MLNWNWVFILLFNNNNNNNNNNKKKQLHLQCNDNPGHDSTTVIFSLFKCKLNKDEECILSNGLNFAVPPTEI